MSVVATEVTAGMEDRFLELVDELHGLIRQRGYGSDRLLQDGSDPRLYYHVRTWASEEAAVRCAEDDDVRSVWNRLDEIMAVKHLVGMAQPVEAWAAPVRTVAREGDRRSGRDRRKQEDRRLLDLRPPTGERRGTERRTHPDRRVNTDRRTTGERRSGQDRRSGNDRRVVEGTGPDGAERRVKDRRVLGERRSRQDRRRTTQFAIVRNESAGPRPRAVLVSAARVARQRAVAPFSGFKVGAALETADGTIITGCNVENATYGLTVCAERIAIFKALSEGHRKFTRVAVVADTMNPMPPCGACRQILWEFGGNLEVLLANLTEEKASYRLQDLLPLPFDARLLGPEQA